MDKRGARNSAVARRQSATLSRTLLDSSIDAPGSNWKSQLANQSAVFTCMFQSRTASKHTAAMADRPHYYSCITRQLCSDQFPERLLPVQDLSARRINHSCCSATCTLLSHTSSSHIAEDADLF
ncbi:TPA: hypothetical protein ACH3X3_006807 [Trebouxia sp. C0006]